MANYYTGVYDFEKLKNADWGGSRVTNNLPLKGEYVQKIINDKFAQKVGCVRQIDDYVFAFANEEDYNKYLEYVEAGDTENADALVMASWQGVKPNAIVLSMVVPEGREKSYLYGAEDMKLAFYWDTQDQGYNHSIDERGTATVKVHRPGSTEDLGTITRTITQDVGLNGNEANLVEINLTDVLKQGKYDIDLTIVGNKSNATISKSFTYSVVELDIKSNFDISTPRFPERSEYMSVDYYLTAQTNLSYVDFVIDGDVEHKYTQEITNANGSLVSFDNIKISDLTEGVHTLQMCARIQIDLTWYTTHIIYHEFVVIRSNDIVPYIMFTNIIKFENSENVPYLQNGDTLVYEGATQYITYPISYAIYQNNIESTKVGFAVNGGDVKEYSLKNNTVNTYSLYTEKAGENIITANLYFSNGNVAESRDFKVNVASANLLISKPETNMRLNLQAKNRTNEETGRDQWNYKDIKGTLNNFTWTTSCGWDTQSNTLVIGKGASVDIEYMPFGKLVENGIDFKGITFILEFATENVSDDEAIICDLRNANGFGLVIRASRVEYFLASNKNPEVTTTFKSGELYRIALVMQGKQTSDKQLMALYVNGVISSVYCYQLTALRNISKNIHLEGSDLATIKIKEIKFCETYMSSDEVLNDFILTRDALYSSYQTNSDGTSLLLEQGMLSLYNANNIYTSTSNGVSPDLKDASYNLGDDSSLVQDLPIMFITARPDIPKTEYQSYRSLHDLEGEEQSKDPYIWVDIYYKNYKHPEMNFLAEKVRVKIQGTSSLSYQKKNFKIYTNRNKYGTQMWVGENCLLKEGEPKDKGKYSFKRELRSGDNPTDPGIALAGRKPAQPVNKFVLKADCSDSSSAHNTGMARLWNELFQNFSINGEYVGRTKAQKWAIENDYKYDVRTCVDGFPIVLFYKDSYDTPEWEFIGKYNFNNDKGDEDVYGFGGGTTTNGIADPFDDPTLFDPRHQMWEGLSSSDEYALGLADMTTWNVSGMGETIDMVRYPWMAGFESRFPEQPENTMSGTNKNLLQTFVEEGHTRDLQEFYMWLSSTRYDDAARNTNTALTETHRELYNPANKLTIAGHKYSQVTIDDEVIVNGEYDNTPENRKKKFAVEKWDHFDIYKVAAYYVYLIRYGAVDQTVKNAIWATEGNEWDKNGSTKYPCQWFFINYDNDTILGSRNDGNLAYGPYISRKSDSAEEDGQKYAYAGDKSVIWNQLEDDAEFMGIVKMVDNALVAAGMTYNNSIYFFNTLQSDKWPERIYNRDQFYKYISPDFPDVTGSNKPANNKDYHLLQGSRMAHRKWWISKRFALYDSLYASGEYKNTTVDFKIDETGLHNEKNDVTKELLQPTIDITLIPGANVYFGWSIKLDGSDSHLGYRPTYDADGNAEPIVFSIPSNSVTIGNKIYLYAAESMASLDISHTLRWLAEAPSFANVNHKERGSQLKKLYVGNTEKALALKNSVLPADKAQYKMYINNVPNLQSIDLSACELLEELDVYGLTYVSTMPSVAKLKYLQVFRAFASGLSIAEFAPGAPLRYLELPSYQNSNNLGLTQLYLNQLNDLTSANIKFETDKNAIDTVRINDCAYLDKDYQFVFDWYNNKITPDADCTLTLESLKWEFKNDNDYTLLDSFIRLLNIGNLTLKGELVLYRIDSNRYASLYRYFSSRGIEVFDYSVDSEFKIRLANPQIFLLTDEEYVHEDNTIKIYPMMMSNGETYVLSSRYEITGYYDGDPTIPGSSPITHAGWNDSIISDESGAGYFTPFEAGVERYVRVSCISDVRTNETLDSPMPQYATSFITVIVKPKTYPNMVTINAESTALTETTKEYRYACSVSPVITGTERGDYSIEWKLINLESAESNFTNLVSFQGPTNEVACSLKVSNVDAVLKGALQVTITMLSSNSLYTPTPAVVTAQIPLIIKDPESILSNVENPVVFNLFKSLNTVIDGVNQWDVTNETTMSKTQASKIVADDIKTLFKGNKNITEFTQFPYFTAIQTIPDGCFSGCTNLESFDFSSSINKIASMVGSIGNNAFEGCALTGITIPASVTRIGDYAFRECRKMKHVVYEQSSSLLVSPVQGIGDYAFENCVSLEELIVPTSMQYMYCGVYMFKGCTGAKSFQFDCATRDMTTIREGMFYDCSGLLNIDPPTNVNYVEPYAFYGCGGAKDITIGEYVTDLGANSYYKCNGVTAITIGDNVARIGDGAFKECNSLEELTIGELNAGLDLNTFMTINYGVFRKLVFLHNTHINYATLGNLLGYTSSGANIIRCIVSDNDYDSYDVMSASYETFGEGYYSVNGTLYYYNGEKMYLIRYYAPEEIENFELFTASTLYPATRCFGCVRVRNGVMPENMVWDGVDYIMDNMSAKALTFESSVAKIGSRGFYGASIEKLFLMNGEKTIPASFWRAGVNIYLQEIPDDFTVPDIINVLGIDPSNRIYVRPEDFERVLEIFKKSKNVRYDIIRTYGLPASGTINVISANADEDGVQINSFVNNVITVGDIEDENHLDTVKQYHGGYKYTNPSGYDNTDVVMEGNTIGQINDVITEILIPENETTCLDFTKQRYNDTLIYTKGIGDKQWEYNPVIKGLGMIINWGYNNQIGYIVVNIPDSFIGKKIWVRYYLESNTSSNYGDHATILSGSASESYGSYHTLIKDPPQFTDGLKKYDSYNEVSLENWPGGRLMISYSLGLRTRDGSTVSSHPRGIDGIVLKAIYVDGYAPAYPDVTNTEWLYFNNDGSVSQDFRLDSIGLAHYDIDEDETEVTVYGLPSLEFETGMEACENYWMDATGQKGTYADNIDFVALENSGMGISGLMSRFTTDPDDNVLPLLPKITLPFNNRK